MGCKGVKRCGISEGVDAYVRFQTGSSLDGVAVAPWRHNTLSYTKLFLRYCILCVLFADIYIAPESSILILRHVSFIVLVPNTVLKSTFFSTHYTLPLCKFESV